MTVKQPARAIVTPPTTQVMRWIYRLVRDPLGGFAALVREYGDVVRLPFGRRHCFYVMARPEYAEHILVSNQDNYVKAFTYRPLRVFLGDGLLTSEGEVWRRHRRLVQPVFAHRQVTSFAPDMVAATARAARSWTHGDTVDAAGQLRRLTLDIVGRSLFGSDLTGTADRIGRALAMLQRGVFLGMLQPVQSDAGLRALLRRAPGLGGAGLRLDAVVQEMIARRRTMGIPAERHDLLDLLMAADEVGAPRLTDAELRAEVLTLLLAGHETTAAALTWTMVLLSRYPAARQRLEAEVDTVLAGTPARAENVDRLPWTRAVLAEAMRLYPPAWTVERDTRRADSVAGVEIPAGATVMTPPYLIHRCADIWTNPEGFAPERFLDANHPRYAYLPFGGGRRICVGAGFAMLEATLVLATITQSHRLDLEPGVTVRPRAEITLRPAGPVPMRVLRR